MLEKSNEMFNIYSKFFSVTFVLLPIFFLQNLQIKPNLSEIYFNIFISETTFYQIKPNLAGMDLGLCLVLIAIHLKILRFDFVPILQMTQGSSSIGPESSKLNICYSMQFSFPCE